MSPHLIPVPAFSKQFIPTKSISFKVRLYLPGKVCVAFLPGSGAENQLAIEIERAVTILHQMRISHASSKGAFGLEMCDGKGGKEMIDAPMLKQAEQIIRLAEAAGLEIPDVPWSDSRG